MMIRRYVVIGCLLLSACAQTPHWPQRSFAERMQRLAQIQSWKLRADLSVEDHDSAYRVSWYWSCQGPQLYYMVLMAPLNVKSARLVVRPTGAMMQVSDQPMRRAASAALLLKETWGHDWPIDAMRYWIRGMPAPGPKQVQLDANQHITELSQFGWTVHFGAYQWLGTVALPGEFLLHKGDLDLHVQVNHWQITL